MQLGTIMFSDIRGEEILHNVMTKTCSERFVTYFKSRASSQKSHLHHLLWVVLDDNVISSGSPTLIRLHQKEIKTGPCVINQV